MEKEIKKMKILEMLNWESKNKIKLIKKSLLMTVFDITKLLFFYTAVFLILTNSVKEYIETNYETNLKIVSIIVGYVFVYLTFMLLFIKYIYSSIFLKNFKKTFNEEWNLYIKSEKYKKIISIKTKIITEKYSSKK